MLKQLFRLALPGILSLALLTQAQGAAPYYKGKSIKIVVGTVSGGGFDLYSRTIARYLVKHIPGNPDVAVENLPGNAFLKATNYFYTQAKPDGLTLANWIGTLVLHQLTEMNGIQFDTRKFEYVGAPTKVHDMCWLSKASGVSSIDQWLASPMPLKLAVTPPGSAPHDNAAVLRVALGLPAQFVSGFKGIESIRHAVESGEVAGLCGLSWEAGKTTWQDRIKSGEVKAVMQISAAPHPELPSVPLAVNLGKTDLGRKLIQAAIHDISDLTYLYSLPPNSPKERAQLLRKAFADTLKSPEFLGDAKKSSLDVQPQTGD